SSQRRDRPYGSRWAGVVPSWSRRSSRDAAESATIPSISPTYPARGVVPGRAPASGSLDPGVPGWAVRPGQAERGRPGVLASAREEVPGAGARAGGADAGSCLPPFVTCGTVCTRTDVDPNHCGRCDNPCPTDVGCSAGQCTVVEATDLIAFLNQFRVAAG